MNKPHKHAELIKQWADGAEIEYLSNHTDSWETIERPTFYEDVQYRVKPQPIECWGLLYVGGTMSAISYPTKAAANSSCIRDSDAVDRIVHMREVTE